MIYKDSVFGMINFDDRLNKIIKSAPIQRLKGIHQNGAVFLVRPEIKTTRFDHSMGAASLLNKLEASMEEQLAGIVHDVSHSTFSHVIDILLENQNEDYHETVLSDFIEKSNIKEKIKELGYSPEKVLNPENFSLLEQEIPFLCADRLDYCFRDCLTFGLIGSEKLNKIIRNLTIENDLIVCKTTETAKNVAELFFRLNRDVFFNPLHEAANFLLTDVLKKTVEQNILTIDDLTFLDDISILNKIRNSKISKELDKINKKIKVVENPDGEYTVKRKRRICDPIVYGTNKKLSELDIGFKRELENFKKNVPLTKSFDIITD